MKTMIKLLASAMSVILVFTSFVFAAFAEDQSKILDEELKEIMVTASDDEIINKVFIGLETGFDKAEFEARYGTGEEYLAAISAFFKEQSDKFIEKLPEDLKADIDHTDPYAACIWFNTTANNIYRLSEYEEVTGIGYGEYTMHAEGTGSNEAITATIDKILDIELKDIFENAPETDIVNIFVGLETGFDKAEFEKKYGNGEAYLAAISEFFMNCSEMFIESLPEDLKKDVDHIDPYGATVWFKTPVKNLIRLAEYEEITGIGYGEYTMHEAGQKNENAKLMLGDINTDGSINSKDARCALRTAAKLESLDDVHFALADFNGDGKVTSIDARLLLRQSAKLD